jgi:Domain of unknown function (DUF4386)
MKIARIAGILYLIVAVTGFFTQFVNDSFMVSGDASATVNKILNSQRLFRSGLMSQMIMTTSWILLALTLYRLFKSVNKDLALFMVSFVLVGSAITYINALLKFAALLVLNDANLAVLVTFFLDLSRHGAFISYIFFGLWLFPLGILIFKSEYFPKVLSRILAFSLMIAGFGYLIDFFTFYLFPHSGMISITPYTFWGELLLLLWLLIKGINVQHGREIA